MEIKIGSLNADTSTIVGRDQYNLEVTGRDVEKLVLLLGQVRQDVERAGLSPENTSYALGELDQAAAELEKPSPNKPRLAARLRRLNDVLVSAGALASAGTSLAGLLAALAH
jgi:hypothetical protein